jgi:integrase
VASIEERTARDGSKSYRVKVRLKGFPAVTASFPRKTDAKKWAEDQAALLRARRHSPYLIVEKTRLGAVIERYIAEVLPLKPLNARSQKAQLLWWKAKLGGYRLADVTPDVIGRCKDELLRTKTPRGNLRSPATVVRYLAVLSHLFSKAEKEWRYVSSNPVRSVAKPSEPRGRVRYLTKDELATLSEACKASRNPHLHTVFVLAVSTGMRLGEILSLRKAHVDLAHSRVILETTKNGERRAVPLAGLALELVTQLVEAINEPTGLLFPGGKGKRPIEIKKAWQNALAKAGIEDFRFHDTRHCAATYLLESGATIAQLAELLGHKTLQMVKRYAHLSASSGAQLISQMNAAVFGAAAGISSTAEASTK